MKDTVDNIKVQILKGMIIMKKRISILIIALVIVLGIASTLYFVKSKNSNKVLDAEPPVSLETEKKSVLDGYERVKSSGSIITETEVETLDSNTEIKLSDEARRFLEYVGKSIDEEREVKRIYSKIFNTTYTRVITDSMEIDLDNNGDIVIYKDLITHPHLKDNYMISDENQLSDFMANIEKLGGFDSYKLTSCSNLGGPSWILLYMNEYENGVLNRMESVNIVIDACKGSVWLYSHHKEMKPDTFEPVISEEEAIECAREIMEKYGAKNAAATLSYERPNFYFEEGGPYEKADFVRLCYNISFSLDSDDKAEGNYISMGHVTHGVQVYVDAETGEILGGDEWQCQ